MKKLSKFLSLALLTVSCCFSAHAKIDDHPATPAQHQQFIEEMRRFAVEYAEKIDTSTLALSWGLFNARQFDRDNDMCNKDAKEALNLYADAIQQCKVLDCKAYASFAFRKMEKYGIQCGYIQGYFTHAESTLSYQFSLLDPLYSTVLKEYLYDTVIYSVITGGTRKWYVCDAQLALHCACLELNEQPSSVYPSPGVYPSIRPMHTDYSYFLAIPLEEYIQKFAIFKSKKQ